VNKVHEIFPLIVYQGSIKSHEHMKKHIDVLRKYWFDGYENESPEYSGRIFLHQEEYCKPFFKDLKTNVDEYLNHLNVDSSKLDYHVSKSWVGFHDGKVPELKPHTHNESNISFVYYVKSSENSDKFCLVDKDNRNQNTGGLFETSKQRNTILSFNKYNCNRYTITPHEGTVLLFPSDVIHQTLESQYRDERIVIAGDIRVTLKPEYYNHHQCCTHPSQWLEL